MKRTTVFLDDEAERELRLAAERRGVPAASVLREALDQYFRRGRRAAPPLRFEAAGRSGVKTTAERSEDLVFRDLKPHGDSRGSRGKSPRNR
jgi:hypothetical protein